MEANPRLTFEEQEFVDLVRSFMQETFGFDIESEGDFPYEATEEFKKNAIDAFIDSVLISIVIEGGIPKLAILMTAKMGISSDTARILLESFAMWLIAVMDSEYLHLDGTLDLDAIRLDKLMNGGNDA